MFPNQYSSLMRNDVRKPTVVSAESASTRRNLEIRGQHRVGDEEHRGDDGDLDVEQLSLDEVEPLLDVEDLAEHGAQRAEEARREPDEGDRAEQSHRAARLDHAVEQLVQLHVARLGVRRHQIVDEPPHGVRRLLRRLVEQVAEAGQKQQREGNGGEEEVERNAAGEKRNVVFAGDIPQSTRIILHRPPQAVRERASDHPVRRPATLPSAELRIARLRVP